MDKIRSPYYHSLEYLIKNNELNLREEVIIKFKYESLDFDVPQEILGQKLTYLYNLQIQEPQIRKNGIIRMLEIEPIRVIKNFLEVQIDASMSIKADFSSFQGIFEELTSVEKSTFLEIVGAKPRPVDIYLNIETHIFRFLFDCEKDRFSISKHTKTTFGS